MKKLVDEELVWKNWKLCEDLESFWVRGNRGPIHRTSQAVCSSNKCTLSFLTFQISHFFPGPEHVYTASRHSTTQVSTVKEEYFLWRKLSYFSVQNLSYGIWFRTLRTTEKKKKVKTRRDSQGPASQVEENLVWKLISYFFQLYESYRIKLATKISSFTLVGCH